MPLIKAALTHEGAAFIDCISPCVAFNNHDGSTKSFDYVREHNEAVNFLDVITGARADHRGLRAGHGRAGAPARRQHCCKLRKLADDYDVHDRVAAMSWLQQRHAAGEIVTGLLYVDPEPDDLHRHMNTVATPFNALDEAELCPGSAVLDKLNASLR